MTAPAGTTPLVCIKDVHKSSGGAPENTLRSWKSESFDTMMKPCAHA